MSNQTPGSKLKIEEPKLSSIESDSKSGELCTVGTLGEAEERPVILVKSEPGPEVEVHVKRSTRKRFPVRRSISPSPSAISKRFKAKNTAAEEEFQAPVSEEPHPVLDIRILVDEEHDDTDPRFNYDEGFEGNYSVGETSKQVEANLSVRGVRSKGQDWQSLQIFPQQDDFQKWLHGSGPGEGVRWVRLRKYNCQEGTKDYYRCCVKACPRQICAIYPAASEDVKVLFNSREHVHAEDVKPRGLPVEFKKEVDLLWTCGVRKPKTVMAHLLTKGIQVQNYRQQVANYLNRKADTDKDTPPTAGISLPQLMQWCEENSMNQTSALLDVNLNNVYCIDHAVDGKRAAFHLILSTRVLLKMAAAASTIHVDGVRSLRWHGAHVLFVGVSDAAGAFFPVLLCVLSHLDEAAYTAVLRQLQRCVSAVAGAPFSPRTLVGDSSAALSQALQKVFPGVLRRVCWQLVRRRVARELHRQPAEVRRQCERDVDALQLCATPQQFETASRLLLLKWNQLWPESGLANDFKTTYLDQNSGWYEGFDPGSYSTNRALAAFVKKIEEQHVIRMLLAMPRFLEVIQDMVRGWSEEVSAGKEFALTVDLPKKLLRAACDLQRMEKTMVNVDNQIYIPAGDKNALTVEDVEEYDTNMRGEGVDSFDLFIASQTSICIVVDDANGSDLAGLSCTCPQFLCVKMCSHVLAIGAAFSLVQLPSAMWGVVRKDGTLGKPRGRPPGSKNKKHMMVQDQKTWGILEEDIVEHGTLKLKDVLETDKPSSADTTLNCT